MVEERSRRWTMDAGGPRRRGMSRATGPAELPSTDSDNRVTPNPRVESLVMNGDIAYFTRADGCLVAVDTADQQIRWTRQAAPGTAGQYPRSPWVCLRGQELLVGGTGLVGYATTTGKPATTYIEPSTTDTVGSSRYWRPVVAPSGEIIATRDAEAVCLDTDGDELWRYQLEPTPVEEIHQETGRSTGEFYHPAADDSSVYLLAEDVVAHVPEPSVEGKIHALGYDGTRRWKTGVAGHVQGGEVASSVTVGDSGVYLSQYSSDGTPMGDGVSRLDKQTGTIEWEHGQSGGQVAYDGTSVFTTDDLNKRVFALEPDSGNIKWNHEVPEGDAQTDSMECDGSVIVDSEYVYAALDGRLILLEKETGRVQDTRRFDHQRPSQFVLSGESLYYGTSNGALYEVARQLSETTPTFCPTCGQDLSALSATNFCPSCGTQL
ncbi:outer membrane protein assembly factor BamB family protein [Halosegnis longus]|uniref:outer membrane protein assembly factor BamB family protein n=2 Tax=Halosegnis longus TaxID=2216012 RepID=UPI0009AE1A28|nr:PQQ-binding-like beta-propeller repeat protein [Halosegnis longus]